MKKLKPQELNPKDDAYRNAKFCVQLSKGECVLCYNEDELKKVIVQHIAIQTRNTIIINAKDRDGLFKYDASASYHDEHKGLAQIIDNRWGFDSKTNISALSEMLKSKNDLPQDAHVRASNYLKEAEQAGKNLAKVIDALEPIKKCVDMQPVEHWQVKYDKLSEKMNSHNLSPAETAEMKKAEAMINLSNDFNAVMSLDKAQFEKQIRDTGHQILIARGQSHEPHPSILQNHEHAQKMLNLIEKIENGSCTKSDVKEAFNDRITEAQQAAKTAHSYNLSAKFGHGSDVAKAMQDGLDRLSDRNPQVTISQEAPRAGR